MNYPKLPSFRLDGKRALVTGAGRGIGMGASIALAESFHGSEEEFANEMNIFAHKLGLKDTVIFADQIMYTGLTQLIFLGIIFFGVKIGTLENIMFCKRKLKVFP